MVKIGVLGAGHLGKIHLRCLQATQGIFDLVGFCDPDPATAAEVEKAFGLSVFDTPEALMEACDAVDIVTPTTTHFDLAAAALRADKHVFIEKPLTRTIEEAKTLINLAAAHPGLVIQVGHVERFNPALQALEGMSLAPMFIEVHRLAPFNPRGTDVSVVLDLMIHDLDIVCSMVPYEAVDIHANGVAVVSQTPDICNARVTFANGCVANLTASRISLKQMRKMRLFQKDAYVSLDFLDKEAQVIRLYDQMPAGLPEDVIVMPLPTPQGEKFIRVDQPAAQPVNAIQMELETFGRSILQGLPPKVGIQDGYRALELAYRILDRVSFSDAGHQASDAGPET